MSQRASHLQRSRWRNPSGGSHFDGDQQNPAEVSFPGRETMENLRGSLADIVFLGRTKGEPANRIKHISACKQGRCRGGCMSAVCEGASLPQPAGIKSCQSSPESR